MDKATSKSLWRPLQASLFRNLLAANFVSDIGAFMQTVGAAWFMLSHGAGPTYVALTQTASSLAFFILALPAGSIGDIVDRRKLIIFTESWMIGAAMVLTTLTISGLMTPRLLLVLTFAISAGDALEAPSWRAVTPELVSKDELTAASSLGGIEFNLARAVGPALAGAVIAVAGVGTAFGINAISFVGVLVVVARWKRPARQQVMPVETIGGATVAALRYVRYSPAIRSVTLRAGVVMFFASAILALLPIVAHRVSASPLSYGFLLGCFGAGAIAGALVLQRACARWSAELVASSAVVILGAAIAVTASVHLQIAIGALMLIAGSAWIVFIALLSSLIQNLAPDWVRARVLAIYLLVFQGGIAAGTALWGVIGQRWSVELALVLAGVGTMATAALGLIWGLGNAPADLSPWIHWPMPTMVEGGRPGLEDGPVLIVIEYIVEDQQAAGFLDAMYEYERVRRRDGAFDWGIFHDTESSDRYVETFLVQSWAEHLRQHARQTQADQDLEKRIYGYARGAPKARHLIYARVPE